jgi:hypothetical protein
MQRRLAVGLALLAVVAGACSGDGNDSSKVSTKKKPTTTLSVDGATTTTGADGPTSTNPTTTLKGAAAAKTSPTTPAVAATTVTDPNAAPAPAQIGTYDYAQSGAVSGQGVPPKGTLVVSGGSSQVFKRYFDPDEPPSDINYSFRDNGPFITSLVVRQGPATFNCSFSSPVPAPPWPATVGRTFSGTASCGNGYTADFSGSITDRRTDDVGGKAVDVVVISSTLHIVGQYIDINVKDTQYWAPSLRVPTYSHEVISGTAFNQPVTGDVTSKLTAATPR